MFMVSQDIPGAATPLRAAAAVKESELAEADIAVRVQRS
jgi:hypothetical protein